MMEVLTKHTDSTTDYCTRSEYHCFSPRGVYTSQWFAVPDAVVERTFVAVVMAEIQMGTEEGLELVMSRIP